MKVSTEISGKTVVASGVFIMVANENEFRLKIEDLEFHAKFVSTGGASARARPGDATGKTVTIELLDWDEFNHTTYSLPDAITIGSKSHDLAISVQPVTGGVGVTRLVTYMVKG